MTAVVPAGGGGFGRIVVLIRMLVVLEPKLAVARSRTRSSSKSPITMPPGETPTAKGEPSAGVNPPEPLLTKTLTEAPPELVVAISRSPSPSRSPSVTA
jgi:hypothetical protein